MTIALEAGVLYDGVPVDTFSKRTEDRAHLDDALLVAQARAGDFYGFEELVRRYRNQVFALAYHFVRNREEAWDISQEAFVKAHKGIGSFRGDSNFQSWLMRITANQCKDFLKKRRLDTVAFDDALEVKRGAPQVPGPEKVLEDQELGDAIQRLVDGLPFKHRTAFVLREYEGLSYEEMARVMNCSIGTVMSRLHHARRKLREGLERLGFVEGRQHG